MGGIITTIQRMSVHDGPGIRSTVFFKACNMHCFWCHNPETWSSGIQVGYIESKCIGCGKCVEICPEKAWSIDSGKAKIDRDKCQNHNKCAEECYVSAIVAVGKKYSVKDIIELIQQDLVYFKDSNGGITLSGGEPLLQASFAKELLKECKVLGIHTAIETNLSVSWKWIEELIPLVDLWMCDLKHSDPIIHKEWTGLTNTTVLSNLSRLSDKNHSIIIRTPIVPGFNDSPGVIENICDTVETIEGLVYYELLPFHPLGFNKYNNFGISNPLPADLTLNKELYIDLLSIPRKRGIRTKSHKI